MGRIKAYCAAALLVMLSAGSEAACAQDMEWRPFDEALAVADTSGQAVLVDVGAPWCGWCHKMKREVYPALGTHLTEQFVLTRINRDDNETTHRYRGRELTSTRLAQQLKATSVPTVVLLTSDGNYLLHLTGFIRAEALRPVLEYVASGAYRCQSYESFLERRSVAASKDDCGVPARQHASSCCER